MLTVITYMVKVSISLALFYVLYKLLLNNDANHKYKRLTLLLSVCAAFAMPLLAHVIPANEISSAPIQKVRELIEMPLLETDFIIPNQEQILVESPRSIPINWAVIVYLSTLSLLFIRFLISYQSILKWLKKATIRPYKDILLAIVNDTIQAFSFSKYIVLSKQDYDQNKTPILLHEEAHIRLHHSIDVVLIELVCYLQWFNPFAWLLKKELKLVHEFQADQAVLNTGIDATKYQLLILEKAVGKRRFATANYFKQGSISKRLKMMKKKQIKRWGVAKALLFLPAGLLLLQAFSQPDKIELSHIDRIVPIKISTLTRNKITVNSPNVPERVSQISSQKAPSSPIVIQVTNEDIFLNGKACTINQLAEKLKPIMTKNPNSVVSLKADKETKMGIIDDVKVQMRLAGVRKLNYQDRSGLTMNIKITKDEIFFNDKLCPHDQLADRMKRFLKKNPNATVQLSSGKNIKTGILTDLIKQLRLSGVSTVNYLVEKS